MITDKVKTLIVSYSFILFYTDGLEYRKYVIKAVAR